jgi:hypothetical protein
VSPFNKPPAIIIQHGKEKSAMLAKAVLRGSGDGSMLAGRGIVLCEPKVADIPLESHFPVVIGAWTTTAACLRHFRLHQIPYLYIDNGYFKPYKQGGYFRATVNGLQHVWDGWLPAPAEGFERLKQLDVEIKPWRSGGERILVTLQTSRWFEIIGTTRSAWLRRTLSTLEAHTDREIVIRDKPLKGSGPTTTIYEDMADAWAVVALSSNCLLQAALDGVPAYATGPCAASPIGDPLSLIEAPKRSPHRLDLCASLAANQWHLDEITGGRMWRDLADRPLPSFLDLA